MASGGYLLIEAMVAMGVLTTAVFGIFALMSQSIKLTRVIDDQYVGTYLAAEGIELAKNLFDANIPPIGPGPWNANGFDVDRCYELDIDTTSLNSAVSVGCPTGSVRPLGFDGAFYRYIPGNSTAYTRTVHIEPIVDGAQTGIQVVSTVKWASGVSSVSLEDKFYNWH